MKLLFFMVHEGYAGNVERPLSLLAERGDEVDVVLEKTKSKVPRLADLLNSLVEEYPNLAIEGAPRGNKRDWRIASGRIRACADYLQYLHPAFADADNLRNRAARGLQPGLVVALNPAPLQKPRAQSALRRLLAAAYQAIPVDPAVAEFIAERRPDALLI